MTSKHTIYIVLKICLYLLLFASVMSKAEKGSGCGNNDMSKQLVAMIQNDVKQQRTQLRCSEKLNEIALIKAMHIVNEQTLWHSAGRMTPNQLLRHHGFQLPNTYPLFGNQVEALAGGEESVVEVFNDFMSSDPHRQLLLGESDFFKSQNQIGAAFVKDLTTEHLYYWVVIIADENNHTVKQNPVIEIKPPVYSKKQHRGKAIKEKMYRNKVRKTWKD